MEDLRSILQRTAETGEGGSSLQGVEYAMNGIKEDNPELYRKLEQDFQVIWKSIDPKVIKETAQKMLDSLPPPQ